MPRHRAHAGRRLAGLLWLLGAVGAQAGTVSKQMDMPGLMRIPAGAFIMGSDAVEREMAYHLDELAYREPVTREQEWYAAELPRQSAETGAFCIMATAVTNRQYAAFIAATRHRAPGVDRKTWISYGLIHPYQSTVRFAWKVHRPPAGREDHPVVLVSLADAQRYAAWLTRQTGQHWRLPTEPEWEKAVRGTDGRAFPWGAEFDPHKLNSADDGGFDSTPAGQFARGRGPFGLLDGAGQVYEWTGTMQGRARAIVKGGSWDDRGCGVCRPAARHSRPVGIKHILIGFRLVRATARENGRCE